MFERIYYFCNNLLSVVIEFCYNLLDLFNTEISFGDFGTFYVYEGVFVIFVATFVARLIASMVSS